MSLKDMCRAMLDQAARDYVYPMSPAQMREHAAMVREEAGVWLHDDTGNPRSFRWCCRVAGVDPDDIREGINAELESNGDKRDRK